MSGDGGRETEASAMATERLEGRGLLTWSCFVAVASPAGERVAASWWRAKAASPAEFKELVRESARERFGASVELSFGPVTGSSRGPWEA